MGVGETHKNAYDFFLTLCLIIVRYACYPQNCERFDRFENEKSSSRCVRTERLRAS